MNTTQILFCSVPYCISESWASDLTILCDRPLSAAYWKLDELSGEKYLFELPEWQATQTRLVQSGN